MTPKQIAIELRKLADALDVLSSLTAKPKAAKKKTPANESEWVDVRTLAEHIGFSYQTARRMVADGEIPGKVFRNGKKSFWRFRLSDVDAALAAGGGQ
jgi:Helix-turn-helix domain